MCACVCVYVCVPSRQTEQNERFNGGVREGVYAYVDLSGGQSC